jgi:hypothetical protein
MSKGFIYVAENSSMAGLLKIGRTEKIPTMRLEELFTTGVPVPFDVAYYPRKTPGFAGGPKTFDNSGSPSRKLRVVSRQAHTCGESRWTNLRA